MDELVVPSELWRNQVRDPIAVVDEAVWLIDHVCEHLGVADLSDIDVLDFGCGTRFAKAFAERGVPVKRYVGVDISRAVVELLLENITDPRLEFHHVDAWNERYNRSGRPLADVELPFLEGQRFDVIWLFSVFTHLAPDDYAAMLRLLRPFAGPSARLFFTLFINERTETGHGFVDRVDQALGGGTTQTHEPPPFVDADPERPLWVALYSRAHALELIAANGWRLQSLSPPGPHLQHHVVCTPA